MSTGSKIEWTDETWNPVVGCTRVSAGCDHCYAVRQSYRLGEMARADREAGRDPGKKALYEGLTVLNGRGDRHFNGVVRCADSALTVPLRWRRPRRVFVNSMADLFHEAVPFEFVDRVFAVMALCPQHVFQVLTKRPERMAEYLTRREISKAWTPSVRFGDGGSDSAKWKSPCDAVYAIAREQSGERLPLIWPLPNVWLGTSVEDQAAADGRIHHLLRCPAAVRFLSCEPLLGEVNLEANRMGIRPWRDDPWVPVDWVIVGTESNGKRAGRFADGFIEAARSIVAQCQSAGVPVFIKQVPIDGRVSHDTAEWPADLRVREWPNDQPPPGGRRE